MTKPSYDQAVFDAIVELIRDMRSDWDSGDDVPMTAVTRLIADLEFESIDVVYLIAAIEERFSRREIPFQDLLMVSGKYVDDVELGTLAGFVSQIVAG